MTIKYNNVYLKDFYTVVGPLESKGKINNYQEVIKDYYDNCKTYEQCEINMQRKVIDKIIKNNGLSEKNIDLMLGGDLINQISISNTTASNYNIPFLGIYSACATFNEELIIGSNYIENGLANKVLCYTSSHNLTTERQFRYPVEYGANLKEYSSNTVTGAISTLLTNEITKYKIESSTLGKVIELGIKDANNMGAIMAPAAIDTLITHLNDLNRTINYYDCIITGDLGIYGSKIFEELLLKTKNIKLRNYKDAGAEIYSDKQKLRNGGSGPVCLPIYLFNKILKENKYKKILLLATGSLHSKVLVDQKEPLSGICHAVSLEVKK